MRILFISRHDPLPGTDGAATYLGQVTAALAARGHSVGCAWTERASNWRHSLRLTADLPPGVTDFYAPGAIFRHGRAWQFRLWVEAQIRNLKQLRLRLLRRSLPPAAPWQGLARRWDDSCNAAEQALVADAIARFRPDVLVANFSWMTTGAPAWTAAQRPLAVLTYDARHCQLLLNDEGQLVEEIDEEVRKTEAGHLAVAQLLVAIQPREAELLRALVHDIPVLVVPPGQPAPPLTSPAPREPIVLFVGSGHAANREAAHWLADDIWPIVRARLPEARLRLAGAVSGELPPSEGIELLGRVSDLSATYAAAAVVVAPIRQGSGVKIKVIEALQHHRAVVVTPVAADGLEFLGDALPVAGTSEEFAAAIIALLTAPERAAAVVKTAVARMDVALAPGVAVTPFLAALEALPEKARLRSAERPTVSV